MNLDDSKLKNLGLDRSVFGKIFSFVDFGNVNHWYEKDERDGNGQILESNKKLIIDIEKLSIFLNLFSDQKRFYYGLDNLNQKSLHIITKARKFFITNTKPIQWVRHYLTSEELKNNLRPSEKDFSGTYIKLPKCNFDVEICIDAIRLLKNYDTFCLFSGDNDFARLCAFLKRNGKKIIIISAGYISHQLKQHANLYVNAQSIKAFISAIKETSPRLRGEV